MQENIVFLPPLKIGINKLYLRYFELNRPIHFLETRETYMSYCKKGHNWCPLKRDYILQKKKNHENVSFKIIL